VLKRKELSLSAWRVPRGLWTFINPEEEDEERRE